MQILQYFINGISIGAVYAIIALGYTMVYGIAKMLNFAHGDIIMVGAYISFCVTNYLGLPAIVSVVISMAVCTVLGIVIEVLAYKPLRGAPSLAVLITAIGVSYFLQNAAQLIWSSSAKNFTSIVTFAPIRLFDGKLVVTGEVLVTVLVSVVVMFALTWFTGSHCAGPSSTILQRNKLYDFIKKAAQCGRFLSGGERGIRTLGTVSRTHAFQACTFNHSVISPRLKTLNYFQFASTIRTRSQHNCK